MADTKTSALTELTALATDDELPIVDTDAVATKRVTTATLAAYAVSVATYSAGWPARPNAELVIWVATDVAATVPGAATGDDIVILAQDADLTAIAALTSAANKVPYSTGAQTWALADFSAAGRALVDDADAAAQRVTLGFGAIPAQASSLATITGTTDTLAAGDNGYTNLYTAAGAVTVTLADISTGFECVLVSLGAGGLAVAAGGMSYANSFTPKLTVAQGEALYVKQTAASTWIVLGGTAT